MAIYIALMNFTQQGVRNAEDSVKWVEAFKKSAAKLGVTMKDVYRALERYDIIAMMAPGNTSVTAINLGMSAAGNIRTQTMRA